MNLTKADRATTPKRSSRILPFISIVEVESGENEARVIKSSQSIGYIRNDDAPFDVNYSVY